METQTVTCVECIYAQGASNKYWRAFVSDNFVATHYGRVGAKGNVTVHHPHPSLVFSKYHSLLSSKLNKGYVKSSSVEFSVPEKILVAAASTNGTGSGGTKKDLAWALVALLNAHDPFLQGADPIGRFVKTREDAIKVSFAAIAGMPVDSSALNYEVEDLKVLAALTDVGAVPAF